jgi:pimeloyl-ACP methyl ester carboxylesterase
MTLRRIEVHALLGRDNLALDPKEKSGLKRSSRRSSFAVVVVTLLASMSQAQTQNQPPRPAPSRSEEMLERWNDIGNKLIAMAQDFPEDKYDFKVQKGQRTFAQNLLHAAALDFVLIRGVSGSNLGPDFGEGDNPSRDVFKTKADIVKFVQEAVADGAQVTQQQGDAGLDKTSKFFGNRLAHNSSIWTFAIEHSGEHYGQLVVYYRANNLVPPDTRRHQAQQPQQPPAARVVDLKASDGAVLKASYFAADKPGPGVLLLHQGNRTRQSWDDLASQLAAAGINTLTLDMRGFGESGGKHQDWPREDAPVKKIWADDIDTAWQYLVSQAGVNGDVIGLGGAGLLGVDNSVLTARRHSSEVKSLVLLSGETFLPGQQFLRRASQLPGLFVVADDDEDPPTEEVMEWIYGISSNPGKRFVHYAGKKAPWNGFEDTGIPAVGTHGTDLFKTHPELPGIIVDWFVTTLITTPGHAPVEPLASASILNQLELPGGVAQVTKHLADSRRRDPKAQLFPEVVVTIMGYDHLAVGEKKLAVEIMKLVVTAYPDSADAYDSLSDAYLADGQKDLARQTAEKALALLDSHTAPASSWSDTEARRKSIRDSAQQNLKQLGEKQR